jgi:hypothetical protein
MSTNGTLERKDIRGVGDNLRVPDRADQIVLVDGGDDGAGPERTYRAQLQGLVPGRKQIPGNAVELPEKSNVDHRGPHEAVTLVLLDELPGRALARDAGVDLEHDRLEIRGRDPPRQRFQKIVNPRVANKPLEKSVRHDNLDLGAEGI